jgi:HD-like signal output (HDOD) protein
MQQARGLHGWIRLLEGSQAAALSGLLKELDRLTASDETSAMQLSNLILKDASLTSHIIRIGNSIQFNASPIPVTTVSRAVVNIGFRHVRSVCLAIKVMESVLCEGASDLLYERIAGSLHAANQSRILCDKFKPTEQEEAFVASLLSNLTELLILSSGQPEAKIFAQKLSADSSKKELNSVAEEVLGVSLDRLAKTLMKRWRIDGLINHIYEPGSVDARLQAIQLGDDIARASCDGWESGAFKTVFKKAVGFAARPGAEVRVRIKDAAEETITSLEQFGNSNLLGLVPSADGKTPKRTKSVKAAVDNEESSKSEAEEKTNAQSLGEAETQSQDGAVSGVAGQDNASTNEAGAQEDYFSSDSTNESSASNGSASPSSDQEVPKNLLEPNPKIQLEALQKISELMLGTLQINAFIKLLLTGLHRGVGLERCAFLLFDKGHKQLSTKFVSGDNVEYWPLKLKLSYGESKGFLPSLFQADLTCLIAPSEALESRHKAEVQVIQKLVQTDSFLIAPLTAQGKKVGLLYADLGNSSRPIDAARVVGFNQFLLQAKLALGVLANRK